MYIYVYIIHIHIIPPQALSGGDPPLGPNGVTVRAAPKHPVRDRPSCEIYRKLPDSSDHPWLAINGQPHVPQGGHHRQGNIIAL